METQQVRDYEDVIDEKEAQLPLQHFIQKAGCVNMRPVTLVGLPEPVLPGCLFYEGFRLTVSNGRAVASHRARIHSANILKQPNGQQPLVACDMKFLEGLELCGAGEIVEEKKPEPKPVAAKAKRKARKKVQKTS